MAKPCRGADAVWSNMVYKLCKYMVYNYCNDIVYTA